MAVPVIARFLSPDNHVQAPYNSQGFNRYSYCFNNPLIYTDPSGNDPTLDLETFNHWGEFSRHQHRNHDMDGTGGADYGNGYGGAFGFGSFGGYGNASGGGYGGYGGGSGGSGGGYGLPGSSFNGGINGTGLNGVYYDWVSGTYRSTSSGNREVGWEYTFYHSYIPAYRQQVRAEQLANMQLHPQSNGNGLLASVKGGPGKGIKFASLMPKRSPDYFSLNIAIAIPNTLTGTLFGYNLSFSLDRYGDFHWSPLGVEFGKSALPISGSLTANWLLQSTSATHEQLYDFLTTNGFNFGGGFIGGSGISWTPGSGYAGGIGIYSPQIGVSYNYTPNLSIFNVHTPFNW